MITAFLRTVILYFFLTAGLRLAGKRQIGELEPGEFVLTMMISDLATVPMQDFGIPLLTGLIPILTLLSFSMLLSSISLRSVRFRELLCGTPAVLIDNGVLCQDVMRRNRYTLDELLEELRGQGYFKLDDIKYAVLENSGHVSVLPRVNASAPTAEDLGLNLPDTGTFPAVLISDGRVISRSLREKGRDRIWLEKILRERGISSSADVFLLTLDESEQILCIRKEI